MRVNSGSQAPQAWRSETASPGRMAADRTQPKNAARPGLMLAAAASRCQSPPRASGSMAVAFPATAGALPVSQRWLGCVQLKDGDIGSLRGWEANRGQHVFELLASPPRADALLRLPHTDDVQGLVADRAVVAQFPGASRAPRPMISACALS